MNVGATSLIKIQAIKEPRVMAKAPAVPNRDQYNPLEVGRLRFSIPNPAKIVKANMIQMDIRVGA